MRRKNDLVFPFNIRPLMASWSLLNNPDKRFAAHADRSPQWNRGAYLVENLEHCGECHTPRNLLQALDNRRKFMGAVQAGWRAYNITSDRSSGIGAWSDSELAHYFAEGHAEGRGIAAGPMGEAVDNSLRFLDPADIAAIVAYLRTIPAMKSNDLPTPKTTPAPRFYAQGLTENFDPRGEAIFAGACASCHDWSGVSPLSRAATLTGLRALNDPSGVNVAQVILNGVPRKGADSGIFRPSFGAAYSDAEVAAVANYVTARFGAKGSHLKASDIAALRRSS